MNSSRASIKGLYTLIMPLLLPPPRLGNTRCQYYVIDSEAWGTRIKYRIIDLDKYCRTFEKGVQPSRILTDEIIYEQLGLANRRIVKLTSPREIKLYSFCGLIDYINKLLKSFKSRQYDKPCVRNPIALMAKCKLQGGQQFTLTIFLKTIDGSTICDLDDIPAGICSRDDTIRVFIGFFQDPRKFTQSRDTTNIIKVNCPLCEIAYRQSLAGRKDDVKRYFIEACEKVRNCITSHGRQRCLIDFTDILTYLIRTRPIIRVRLSSSGLTTLISIGDSSKTPVKIELVKGNVEARMYSFELNVTRGFRMLTASILIPLPVTVVAPIDETYALKFSIDLKKVKDIIEKWFIFDPNALHIRLLTLRAYLISMGIAYRFLYNIADALSKANKWKLCKTFAERVWIYARNYSGRALKGDNLPIKISGLRIATHYLIDWALNNNFNLIECLLDNIKADNNLFNYALEYFTNISAISIAHLITYAVMTGLDMSETMIRLYSERAYSHGNLANMVLIETRSGGFGVLTSINSSALESFIANAITRIDQISHMLIQRRNIQAASLSKLCNRYRGICRLLEQISEKLANYYGAKYVRGGQSIVATGVPSWLTRLSLTHDNIRHFANILNVKIEDIDERTWSTLSPELIPAYFDLDFIDASAYDLAGIPSWLNDTEIRLLVSRFAAEPVALEVLKNL